MTLTKPRAAFHRTWQAVGNCLWPWSCWVVGEGPWAVVCPCRKTSVSLHATREAAMASRVLHGALCGSFCSSSRHKLVYIHDGLHPKAVRVLTVQLPAGQRTGCQIQPAGTWPRNATASRRASAISSRSSLGLPQFSSGSG